MGPACPVNPNPAEREAKAQPITGWTFIWQGGGVADVGARELRAICETLARSRRQLVEQGLGLLQIERIKALGEPAVDRSEKIAGLLPLALIAPEPSYAHCCA